MASAARQASSTGLQALKPALERLYDGFNATQSTRDPIWTVRRHADPADREIVAFIAAAVAFGRVQSVINTIEAVLDVLGPSPAAYVRAFAPERASEFATLTHRWIRGRDLAALVWLLHQMLVRDGSLEGFFARGLRQGATTIEEALDSFSSRALALDRRAIYGRARPAPGVGYFFSKPSTGAACKRLNLFLRWVVRRDAVDLGLWSAVRPSQLVVPLDTHIIRVGRCVGLTRRTSPGWRMAVDITAALRMLDPVDPVRYDFAMCHLGMMGNCGFGTTCSSAQCPLRDVCRPKRYRTRRSTP